MEITEYLKELERHYARVPSKLGFARKCSMALPDCLEGLRILDIGCRSGKGVMKLADKAGPTGFVLGIDWLPDHIELARAYAREHNRNPLDTAPWEFRIGYPEALDAAGVEERSFDAAFVNSSMNLFFDLRRAISQIGQALKPNGLLVVDGVFASAPRDPDVVEKARQLDNSVQSALFLQDFLDALQSAGFTASKLQARESVRPETGFSDDATVDCVNATEMVEFVTYTVEATKATG